MPIEVIDLYKVACLGIVFGIGGLLMKKFKFNDDINELIMLAAYVYMLYFVVQLIIMLMESMRNTFLI